MQAWIAAQIIELHSKWNPPPLSKTFLITNFNPFVSATLVGNMDNLCVKKIKRLLNIKNGVPSLTNTHTQSYKE